MHVIIKLRLAEINQLEFNWHWELNTKKLCNVFFESLIDQDHITSSLFSLNINRIQLAAINSQG